MSNDEPRRGAGLGDEPTYGYGQGDDWFRPSTPAVPQRALRAREEWANVPWGQEPTSQPISHADGDSDHTGLPRSADTPPSATSPSSAASADERSTATPSSPRSPLHTATAKGDDEHRRKLRVSLLLTLASTLLPGSGLLGAPHRGLKIFGAATALGSLAVGAFFAFWALRDTAGFAAMAVDPAFLGQVSASLIVLGLLWVVLIATTHIATRPGGLRDGRRLLGAAVVTALAFGVSAPSAIGARYSHDQIMLVETVFGPDGTDEVQSASRPTLAEDPKEDPWKDIPRVNVLLLGADGNQARAQNVAEFSIRTDTIIVASIDTVTGETLLVQVPRNLRFTPFKKGSDLDKIWPDGQRGEEEADAWITNLYSIVELQYPDALRGNTHRGAEAIKEAVESVTGLEADYFMMLDIDGLQRLINAMGGVRVNINEPLPMGTAKNCRDPERCLQPGPNQKLNGYEAMWYARSRVTTSDYSRMARQSCLIDAVIKQANPATMLTSYEGIAKAAGTMVTTDIPQRDLKAFVQLAFKVKDAKVSRLVYTPGKNGYSYERPDFPAMRKAVRDALKPPAPVVAPTTTPATESASPTPTPTTDPTTPSPSPTSSPTAQELVEGAQTVADACAWQGEEG